MKERSRESLISSEWNETIRQSIIALLAQDKYSARGISIKIGIREKEVYEHLEHIRKSIGRQFTMIPARCRKCDFIFGKRARLKKPGKCPLCHNQSIEAPFYTIKKN